MPGRDDRKKLIAELEKLRGSRLLTYITGDRMPVPAQIGDDAVRPLYEQLRGLGQTEKLDLFIYSRGGAIDVPWRMVTALRGAATEWTALIPFRANSAATLLALGAEKIVMGRNGELGPIDPSLQVSKGVEQTQVSVEDVMAYVKFAKERGGLSDQAALAASLGKLADRVDPLVLGNIYRTYSHIRDVARRVLITRKRVDSAQIVSNIVETLAERVYAHGHAIGLLDAKELGLPAEAADAAQDALMWQLLGEYEKELKLLEPLDPVTALANSDKYSEPATIALIESTGSLHRHSGELEVRAKRQLPPSLNVAINVNADVRTLPTNQQQQVQQLMAQLQPLILAQANDAVRQALQAQAPLVGVEVGFRNGRWSREP